MSKIETDLVTSPQDPLLLAEHHVGTVLLDRGALLLSTAHDVFVAEASSDCDITQNARWLLSRLIGRFEHHLSISRFAGRKSGTMLHRAGFDNLQALYYCLVDRRQEQQQHRRDLEYLQSTILETPERRSQGPLLEEASTIIHSDLKKLATHFKGREYQDARILSELSLEAIVREIPAAIWDCIWIMVYGERMTKAPQCTADHVKVVRALNITSCMPRTLAFQHAHSQCSFCWSEAVDAFSHSIYHGSIEAIRKLQRSIIML